MSYLESFLHFKIKNIFPESTTTSRDLWREGGQALSLSTGKRSIRKDTRGLFTMGTSPHFLILLSVNEFDSSQSEISPRRPPEACLPSHMEARKSHLRGTA